MWLKSLDTLVLGELVFFFSQCQKLVNKTIYVFSVMEHLYTAYLLGAWS